MALRKALNVGNIQNQKLSFIDFEKISPDLYQAFGNPQNKGVWFVWGYSGSGKSSFILDLLKAFCKELKAIHNELEEDLDDADFVGRIIMKNMHDVKDKYFAASYNYEEMCEYLDRKNSPQVVLINSVSYFFDNYAQYMEFAAKYRKRNKIIIITELAKGNNPYSDLGSRIMGDANKKVFVSGYLATCKGRTIGPNGGTYIIWKEGYEKLRGAEKN